MMESIIGYRSGFMEHVTGNTKRVMYVDDEPDITDIWSDILSGLGYQVTEMNNSADALAIFESDPFAFDAIITDHAMPGMTGEVLTRRIHKIRPDIPVIMVTGYSTTVTRANFREFGINEFLTKPAAPYSLDSAIRRVLSDV